VREPQRLATLAQPLAEGCGGVHSIPIDVGLNCVTPPYPTDSCERSLPPAILRAQP
jgi:hypothetical protein